MRNIYDLYSLFTNNKKLSKIFGLILMVLLEPLNTWISIFSNNLIKGNDKWLLTWNEAEKQEDWSF
jgi:hypothetical protein